MFGFCFKCLLGAYKKQTIVLVKYNIFRSLTLLNIRLKIFLIVLDFLNSNSRAGQSSKGLAFII